MQRLSWAVAAALSLVGFHPAAGANATTSLTVETGATSLDPSRQGAPTFGPAFVSSVTSWTDAPLGPPFIDDRFLTGSLVLIKGYDPNGWGSVEMDGSSLVAEAFTDSAAFFGVSAESAGSFAVSAFTVATFTVDASIVAGSAGSGGSVGVCFQSSCSNFSDGSHVVTFTWSNDTDTDQFLDVDVTARAFSSGVPEPGNAGLLLAGAALLAGLSAGRRVARAAVRPPSPRAPTA